MPDEHATCGLVPSWIKDRNSAAEKAGIEVGVRIIDGEVVSTWLGSREQLNSCGMRIDRARIWQPSARSEWLCAAFFHAEARREGDDCFSLLIKDDCALDHRLFQGVNRYEMRPPSYLASSVLYHAPPAKLVACSLIQSSWVPLGEAKGRFCSSRSGCIGDEYSWNTRLCYDGTVVFQKDDYSEAIKQKRKEARRRSPNLETQRALSEERLRRSELATGVTSATQDAGFQRFMANATGARNG